MLNEYHFDLGDSGTGVLGLCARVVAETREVALQILQDELEDHFPGGEIAIPIYDAEGRADDVNRKDPGISYICAYVNPKNITVKDIDEEEEVWPEDKLSSSH